MVTVIWRDCAENSNNKDTFTKCLLQFCCWLFCSIKKRKPSLSQCIFFANWQSFRLQHEAHPTFCTTYQLITTLCRVGNCWNFHLFLFRLLTRPECMCQRVVVICRWVLCPSRHQALFRFSFSCVKLPQFCTLGNISRIVFVLLPLLLL